MAHRMTARTRNTSWVAAAAVLGAGAAAVGVSLAAGGLSGPLATLCIAPAALAALIRRPSLLPLGAGISVAALGISGLATAFLDLPSAPAAAAPWIGAATISLVTVAFAAGLVAFRGDIRRERRRNDRADLALRLLAFQPTLLLSLDRTGSLLEVLGGLPGYDSEGLKGRSLGHLASDADLPALAAGLHAVNRAGVAHVTIAARGDTDRVFEIALQRTGDGQIVASLRDASVQHAREARLEAARAAAEQRDAGKSRFLANMSHELRTPLNAIMGFSDIMRQRLFGPLADRYAEYAELIHESGSHLLELINDVLDMSKIEAERFDLTLERLDAGQALTAVLRLMRGQADRAGVALRGVLPEEPLWVEADRRALKQIALNLVSNALKFTPRAGAVTLTLQAATGVLELVVADTGVGISPQDLQRLGRPYEQAGDADQRAAGSGLGLSLVRALAELHGGGMALESRLGAGTTVTVRMPVLATNEQALPRVREA